MTTVTDRKQRPTTMPLLTRMAALRGEGLSYGAIAVVVNLDNGTRFDARMVEYRLSRYFPDVKPVRGVLHMAKPGNGSHLQRRALAGRLVGR